jgi:16S rRNA (guanine527-N7)-methyltransferase
MVTGAFANRARAVYNRLGMDPARIAELLEPFVAAPLGEGQLRHISTYIDIFLRWNARINLTAVRQPEQIVTRHFGESLFAAARLFPEGEEATAAGAPPAPHVIDVGSGAGFPGMPIKIWAPQIHLTLIESNQRKATFLREVSRALTLTNIDVFGDRAEDFPPASAAVVTLRAVERFESVLPTSARLVAPGGRLALLVSQAQIRRAHELALDFAWGGPISVPQSSIRVLLIGKRTSEESR